jgi:cytochrome c-type biogenesis protein
MTDTAIAGGPDGVESAPDATRTVGLPQWLPGMLAALVTGGLAVGAALATGPGIGSINSGVEAVSSASSSLIGHLADALPVGYAFGAGMVAALNPCGFALLPAYLGLFLGTDADRRGSRRMLRALGVSAAVSAGFIVLFGVAGLVLAVATSSVARYFPWIGLLIGAVLLVAGGRMLGGATLYTSIGERLSDSLGIRARNNNHSGGYFMYGLAYGAASLCCTLPIFLTVVAGALTAGGPAAAGLDFLFYALGMSLVVTLFTLGTALFRSAATTRARILIRYVQPASAALLLLAGAYIVYYWLTLGGLLRVALRN